MLLSFSRSGAALLSPWRIASRALATQRFPVPTMGDSITEGTLLSLHKKVGDYVAIEELLAMVETDKVTVEVRAPASGTIKALFYNPNDNVLVGADLVEIDVGAGGAGAAATAQPPLLLHRHRSPLRRHRHHLPRQPHRLQLQPSLRVCACTPAVGLRSSNSRHVVLRPSLLPRPSPPPHRPRRHCRCLRASRTASRRRPARSPSRSCRSASAPSRSARKR